MGVRGKPKAFVCGTGQHPHTFEQSPLKTGKWTGRGRATLQVDVFANDECHDFHSSCDTIPPIFLSTAFGCFGRCSEAGGGGGGGVPNLRGCGRGQSAANAFLPFHSHPPIPVLRTCPSWHVAAKQAAHLWYRKASVKVTNPNALTWGVRCTMKLFLEARPTPRQTRETRQEKKQKT